jgi:hypothetical protein
VRADPTVLGVAAARVTAAAVIRGIVHARGIDLAGLRVPSARELGWIDPRIAAAHTDGADA